MEQLHSLLKRQLRRSFGDSFSIPEEWEGLIHAVNSAYREFDVDREMLERSLDLSSQELLQANSEMQAIFRAIPDTFLQMDYEGNIIDCKAGNSEDFVILPSKFIGKNIRDILQNYVCAKFFKSIRQVKETKSIVRIEYSLLTRNKKYFYEARLVPLLESRIISIVRDITKYKLAEEALRESEERYRSVVENAAEGIVVVQDGKLRYLNPQALKMTQASFEDIYDLPFISFVHPDDRDLVFERYQKRIRGEDATQNYDFRVIGLDGLLTWVQASGIRIIWDGKPATLSFLADITGRKMAEEALCNSEDLYRTVVSSASDGIYIQESTGKILTWNKTIEKVFGIDSEDALGHTSSNRHWETIRDDGSEFQGDDHPSVRTLMTGKPCKNVVMGVKNAETDQLSWININTTPLFKEDSPKPYAVVISFSDITERKKFESELENRVKERTEKLESKTAEMERFIYTVSHDLRSPLVTIGGFVGFMKQDLEKGNLERVHADLRIIGEAIQKMDRLLGDTLQLSRIGRVANPPEEVIMGEIVQEALAQTAEKIRTRDVEVSVAPDMPVIHADRMRIVEVLVNLIENSVKYMGDEPNPHIDIGYRTDGFETVFFVRDNGMGIDPSQHKNVFGLFCKVDPKSEGTGAGLAIVKRIIEVHGGRIWIESVLGGGCAVCFTLAG